MASEKWEKIGTGAYNVVYRSVAGRNADDSGVVLKVQQRGDTPQSEPTDAPRRSARLWN